MDEMNLSSENDMDELEAMFGTGDNEFEEIENVNLTQSLEGFASCFPDWDLHPFYKQR